MRLFGRGGDASTLDLLVAGLGNPGREHERKRRLGDARVRGEVLCERDEALARGEVGEQRVKRRRVHTSGGTQAPRAHRSPRAARREAGKSGFQTSGKAAVGATDRVSAGPSHGRPPLRDSHRDGAHATAATLPQMPPGVPPYPYSNAS